VGSAAARIAHRIGARVIGTARRASDTPATGLLPVDEWIDLETTDLAIGVRAVTNGRGAEVVFDVVCGTMFDLLRSGVQVAAYRLRRFQLSVEYLLQLMDSATELRQQTRF
jgi:NADPH:quinone reductase-like Zn-dependent oxidoreductase